MSNTSNSQSTGQGHSSGQNTNPSGDNRQGQGKSTSGKSPSLAGTSQAGTQEAAKTGDSTVDDTLRPGEDRTSGRPFKGDQPSGSQSAMDELETDMELGTGGSSKEDDDKREKADPAKEPTAGRSNSSQQGDNPTRPGSTRDAQKQSGAGGCGCG